MREALEARFGSNAGNGRVTGDGDGGENTGVVEGGKVAEMAAFRPRL